METHCSMENPECFVPEESASHKFIDVQKGKKKQTKKKGSSANMNCKMSRPASNIQIQAKTFTHVTLGTDDDDYKLLVLEDFEQEFLKTRVLAVVFYNKSSKHVMLQTANTNGTLSTWNPPLICCSI